MNEFNKTYVDAEVWPQWFGLFGEESLVLKVTAPEGYELNTARILEELSYGRTGYLHLFVKKASLPTDGGESKENSSE